MSDMTTTSGSAKAFADASEAGRALNRARWGRTRTDRLVTELRERRADLLPDQVEQLRELVQAGTDGN
jgi:hypothetical protein